MSKFLGTDVSGRTFDIAIDVAGKRTNHKFDNTLKGYENLERWALKAGVQHPHIVMEATGRYHEKLSTWAFEHGWKVTVVNPRIIHKFSQSRMNRNKTDKLDAITILRYAECATSEELREWTPKSPAHQALRDIQMRIRGLTKELIREKNRLKCGLDTEFSLNSIRDHITYLEGAKKHLEKEAKRLIKADERLLRKYTIINSIPGCGDVTARFLLSEINFEEFKKGRQLVNLAGLAPRTWASGTSVHKRDVISRIGHRDLRAAMFLPAVSAVQWIPSMKEYRASQLAKGKKKKQVICAVMAKLLRLIFSLIRDDRLFEKRLAA